MPVQAIKAFRGSISMAPLLIPTQARGERTASIPGRLLSAPTEYEAKWAAEPVSVLSLM